MAERQLLDGGVQGGCARREVEQGGLDRFGVVLSLLVREVGAAGELFFFFFFWGGGGGEESEVFSKKC